MFRTGRSSNFMIALAMLGGVVLSSGALASPADDRAAIEDLHGRYLFAFDWHDAASYAATFAEDGTLDYGAGEIKGRKAIAAFIEEGRKRAVEARAKVPAGERPKGGRHIISNIVVKLDGNKAHGLAYWTHMTSGPTGYGTVDFWGHYEDELVKVDGQWLYARRRIYNQAIPEWSAQDANPVVTPSAPPRQRATPAQGTSANR
ncbi:hypothetical protein M2333_001593 [Sphingobium sp. B11D3B]|uniref:nuclear transport factor 2 family protein n=1 Tax=unclassified Sphingobium TaxID=2611147 RepID=UPI002224FBA2|nr:MULTISPECIES: nuclear transport factor 2 family protein [unclassified Sphingobium]MCW2365854.1 hypothetical protein [Sphingobium sp. B7D2B]MCW2388547.1 hypothetical protein [Sphingobium sp. B11D3B]